LLTGDRRPDEEAALSFRVIGRGCEAVTARPEVPLNRPESGQEPLSLTGWLKSPHRPFALAGRLVRVLGAIVQSLVLAMLYTRQDLPFGGSLAWIIVRQGSLGKEDERNHLWNFAVEPSG
jgi:hypothetical protein